MKSISQRDNASLIEPDGYNSLVELALDLRWSWNHGTDVIWNQLDPVLWDLTRNPWAMLQTVSPEKLQFFLSNPTFRQQVDDLVDEKKRSTESSAWFQKMHPQSPLTSVAYFSMEFMLSEALPIYSGGLAADPSFFSDPHGAGLYRAILRSGSIKLPAARGR
jgi:starch phosphorylase